MKTFTIRDLDREPGKVLAAADHDGVARVRSRDGRSYVVRPEAIEPATKSDWAEFAIRRRSRLKKLFPTGPVLTPTQARAFDRMLAGDGTAL